MNHPAFLYGHLAIYGNRMLGGFLDREDLVNEVPFDAEAVAAGAPCLSDASKYATKDVVLPYFKERYETVIEVLPSVSADVSSGGGGGGGGSSGGGAESAESAKPSKPSTRW